MKKIIAISLCCLVILAGCGKSPATVPHIGTEETTTATDPIHEGPLDFGELEVVPSPTRNPTGSGGASSEAPAPTVSGTAPTEATQPSVPAPQATAPASGNNHPTTEPTVSPSTATEPATEPATMTTDPEGFYNQVVRP